MLLSRRAWQTSLGKGSGSFVTLLESEGVQKN